MFSMLRYSSKKEIDDILENYGDELTLKELKTITKQLTEGREKNELEDFPNKNKKPNNFDRSEADRLN
jgi:hypothetical protein